MEGTEDMSTDNAHQLDIYVPPLSDNNLESMRRQVYTPPADPLHRWRLVTLKVWTEGRKRLWRLERLALAGIFLQRTFLGAQKIAAPSYNKINE